MGAKAKCLAPRTQGVRPMFCDRPEGHSERMHKTKVQGVTFTWPVEEKESV